MADHGLGATEAAAPLDWVWLSGLGLLAGPHWILWGKKSENRDEALNKIVWDLD